MSRALEKLAADLNLDLEAIYAGPAASRRGSDGRRVEQQIRLRESYDETLLAFREWCLLRNSTILVELRDMCLVRMGFPAGLPRPLPQELRPKIARLKPDRKTRGNRKGSNGGGGKKIPVRRDSDGRVFATMKHAAEFAGVTPPSMRRVVHSGRPLRGSTWSIVKEAQRVSEGNPRPHASKQKEDVPA